MLYKVENIQKVQKNTIEKLCLHETKKRVSLLFPTKYHILLPNHHYFNIIYYEKAFSLCVKGIREKQM